ncbi:MAG: anti-sigma factor, partial [Usitatibacter sp.]
MRKLAPDLAHALAAEYVLGTLRGRARRRFEAIAHADGEVAAILRRWEEELTPLAERVPTVEPPARVWREIEARLGPRADPAGGLWASVGFWRGFGLVAGGLASVLLATFLYLSTGPRGEPVFVAVLTEAAPVSTPRIVVSMHSPNLLRVRMVKPWKGMEGKGLELWVLPKEGAPRSLGMVANAMGDTLITITATDPRVQGANALAVSMEPAGGSPTGQPTGPVLCSGMVA